jgi:GT2 family glycosyltransferase
MTFKKSISVVIPNYNGEQLLQKNLPLLYQALNTANLEYEIIIPDDASTDNSIHFLKNNYPQIILVRNKTNSGFATNINSGIRKATKELVFLLNSDIELTPDYFLTLLPYFQDNKTFGVTGRIIGIDSDEIQDGAKYPQYTFGNIKSTINGKRYSYEHANTHFFPGRF